MKAKSQPRLKRHYSVVAHSANTVELRFGVWNPVSFTLNDESESGQLLRILARLDGTASIGDIARHEQIARSDVTAVVSQLDDLDLLEHESTNALDHYLDHLVPNLLSSNGRRPEPSRLLLVGDPPMSAAIAHIFAETPELNCEVVNLGNEQDRWLRDMARGLDGDALELEESSAEFSPWAGHLAVFATESVNPVYLRAFNRTSLRHRIPWIYATVDGPFLFVGPTFVPGRSSCYECFEMRVLMNLREGASYQTYKRALAQGTVRLATAPLDTVLRSMLASLTAFEALNYLLTGAAFTIGKVLALYLPTMEFAFNDVLRVPGCQACGSSPERDDGELYFDVRALLANGG